MAELEATAARRRPKLEERQARVFDLSIQGFSNVQIATQLRLHRTTVATDISVEAARRAAERHAGRAELIEKCVSHYEKLVAD